MKKNTTKFLELIDSRLLERFGIPITKPENDPTGALVRGILSANTNDVNRDRAFDRLFEAYSKNKSIDWEMVKSENTDFLANIIKPAGMSVIRATRIKNALKWLENEFNEISANKFLSMDPSLAFQKLQEIKGIGAKTAAVFLVFNREPGTIKYFPVDTHIHRVAARIGIFPEKYSPAKMIEKFTEISRPDFVISLHVNLIELGRITCKARKAFCYECPILDICEQNLPKEKIERE